MCVSVHKRARRLQRAAPVATATSTAANVATAAAATATEQQRWRRRATTTTEKTGRQRRQRSIQSQKNNTALFDRENQGNRGSMIGRRTKRTDRCGDLFKETILEIRKRRRTPMRAFKIIFRNWFNWRIWLVVENSEPHETYYMSRIREYEC